MSGHSKWSQIKYQKASEDAKKGQLFSKLSQEISTAARINTDPQANPSLASLIEKARQANMPKENIERAILRAKGGEGSKGEEFLWEVFASAGEGLLVKGMTYNKNRTLSEVKQILGKYGAKLVGPGGVSWNFEGPTPKIKKPASSGFKAFFEELQAHPDVRNVLTDAV